jgi:signal transduction histidine kinase
MDEVPPPSSAAVPHDRGGRPWRDAEPLRSEPTGRLDAAVVVIGIDETVRCLNPAAEALTGWKSDDALAKPLGEVVCLYRPAIDAALDADPRIPGAGRNVALGPVRCVLRRGQSLRLPQGQRLLGRDGTVTRVDASVCPVADRHGVRRGAMLVLRRSQARALPSCRPRAAHPSEPPSAGGWAVHSDSERLARVSHEMRTPLNAIMGFAQLLLEPQTGLERRARYAEQIRAASQHLLSMVDDLLDSRRADPGDLRLQLQRVDLAAAVQRTMPLLEADARAGQVELCTRVPPGLAVTADATRLQQVLLNVASNAVKYNRPAGKVTFTAERSGSGAVGLRVGDSGIGMSAEQLERLFRPYERLGQERSSIPGSGLGLLIARDLVVRMGGSLRVSSEPGEGTSVMVWLPAAAP